MFTTKAKSMALANRSVGESLTNVCKFLLDADATELNLVNAPASETLSELLTETVKTMRRNQKMFECKYEMIDKLKELANLQEEKEKNKPHIYARLSLECGEIEYKEPVKFIIDEDGLGVIVNAEGKALRLFSMDQFETIAYYAKEEAVGGDNGQS